MKQYFFLFTLFIFGGCRSSILEDPTTHISYSISEKSQVKLAIENNYNTEVAVLVDKVQDPGNYYVAYDVSGFLEGMYYYTLEINSVDGKKHQKFTKTLFVIK